MWYACKLVLIHLHIFGIIGFCFIPLIEKRVKDISKGYRDEDKKEQKHFFYTIPIKALGLLVDIDAWYSAMTTLNIVLKSPCSIYIMIAFWLAYAFVTIVLLIYLPLKIISFNKKKCDYDNVVIITFQ